MEVNDINTEILISGEDCFWDDLTSTGDNKVNFENINIDELVSDRKKFDQFVYTPATVAIQELKKRWTDKNIKIPIHVPKQLESGFLAFFYISLISPNYQVRRYISIADALGLTPLILEQKEDKLTSNNEWKHSLCKLRFFGGFDKKNNIILEKKSIIDFALYDGKNIMDVKTHSGKYLVDFHHNYFFNLYPGLKENVIDISDWVHEFSSDPKVYYKAFMYILIKHGIQFENFMLDEKEITFTKEVFLPAFIDVYKETGLKPLIVALEPTQTEGKEFWISYPKNDKTMLGL